MGRKNGDDGTNKCLVEQKIEKDNGKDGKIRKSRLCKGLNIILVELEPAPNVRIGLMDISRTILNVTAPETIVFSFRVTNGKNL
jgi:hypothetical protein